MNFLTHFGNDSEEGGDFKSPKRYQTSKTNNLSRHNAKDEDELKHDRSWPKVLESNIPENRSPHLDGQPWHRCALLD